MSPFRLAMRGCENLKRVRLGRSAARDLRRDLAGLIRDNLMRAHSMDIARLISILSRSTDRARRLRHLGDRSLSKILLEVVWAHLPSYGLPADVVSEACDRLKRRGFRAGNPDPVSPTDCRHERSLLVQSGSGGPPHRSEYVTVCPDCGEFRISARSDGVTVTTRFTLPTEELVRAAGQYERHLKQED